MTAPGSPPRAAAVAAAVAAAALAAGGCGGHRQAGVSQAGGRCPLTGLPAPGGRVPERPALAVKVENLPQARPQWGLGGADVVYEEPVESGITRFVVVYQCRDAARIEPIRSARIVDPDIVGQFGAHPLFAYAGGIQPAVAAVRASPLVDVGASQAPSAYRRDPARSAPHDLTSSTTALYAAGATLHAPAVPPPAVFAYGPVPGEATPARQVQIHYPYSDLAWTWEPAAGLWERSYAGAGPAARGEGGQVTAANVIVMKVVVHPSPFVEDPTGIPENLLDLAGSGPAEVFRSGAETSGRWDRPSLTRATRYLDAAGRDIPLAPGATWVELVPTTVGVGFTP